MLPHILADMHANSSDCRVSRARADICLTLSGGTAAPPGAIDMRGSQMPRSFCDGPVQAPKS